MSRTSIGALRHRVTIETETRLADGGGGVTVTWTTHTEVWGAIAPVSGIENLFAEGVSSRLTHVVHIRWCAGLKPAMRVRYGSRILEIAAVLDVDERRRHLKLLCRERDL